MHASDMLPINRNTNSAAVKRGKIDNKNALLFRTRLHRPVKSIQRSIQIFTPTHCISGYFMLCCDFAEISQNVLSPGEHLHKSTESQKRPTPAGIGLFWLSVDLWRCSPGDKTFWLISAKSQQSMK